MVGYNPDQIKVLCMDLTRQVKKSPLADHHHDDGDHGASCS
jgi:hypothetical protein